MKFFKDTSSTIAALSLSLLLLGMSSAASAALLAYEPFDYPLGPLNGGTPTTATGTPTDTTGGGFRDAWFSGGAGTQIVEGLSFPGLETSNKALQWSPNVAFHGINLASPIVASTRPTVYVSFLFRAPAFTANKTGFGVDNGAGANQGYYMGMTAPGVFGVATGINGSGTVLGTAAETISYNTTYFVVVRYEANAGGTYYQSGSIWINPVPGAPAPAASGTFTGSYSVMTGFHTFMTALGGSTVTTDEVRFGTTWESVTPANDIPPPAAPSALLVESVGVNTVNLSWTAAIGAPDAYNLKRATSSGGPFTTIGTVTAPTLTFTDTVTGGTTFYYVVSALNAGGESANTPAVSATPILGVPDAPANLVATAGDGEVALIWTAPALGNPTSYNVRRSTVPGGPFTEIVGTTAATTFTDTTVVNDMTYFYVVAGVNAAGEGGNSNEVQASPAVFTGIYEPFNYPIEDNLVNGTPSTAEGFGVWTNGVAGWITTGLTYPGLPTSHNAMRSPAGRQSVSLDTPLSSGTKWISFLFQSSPGNPGGNRNGVYFLNGGTGLFFGFGLEPFSGTQGYLGLGAMNTVGTTPQGATLLARTGLGTYGATYLIVLRIDFDTSGSNDTITVYVNPTANQPAPDVTPAATVTNFNVGTISGIGMNVQGGGEITVDEIRIADTYVDVIDAVVTPPNAPTGLTATPGNNAIALSWTAATGGAPVSYNIKRATDAEGPFTVIGTRAAPSLSFTDAVLGGVTYHYVVSAVNAIGESPDSAPVSAAAILAPPPAPVGLSATAGDSEVSLSWQATNFASGYEIKRASSAAGPFVSIGTTTGLTFTDTGVTNAQTYFYVVAALNAGGSGPNSSAVSATPIGPLPFVLQIEPGVGISWFASNNVIYQVQWALEDLGEDTEWNNLGGEIIGNDSTMTVFDPHAGAAYIYQVVSF
jgi:fibronectin type 3 domain-containing protein